MALSSAARADDIGRRSGLAGRLSDNPSALTGAVSWGAVAAGAAAAASLSLILLILGVGLGLSAVSPWALDGVSGTTFGVSTILWLSFTQLAASAVGGYLAGRLRTKWTEVHSDEIYFRDTAHGFLAWAVASLATAALLGSVIGSIVGGVASTAGSAVGGVSAAAALVPGKEGGTMDYFVDSLFRRSSAATPTAPALPNTSPETSERSAGRELAEVGRIFMNASRADPLPADDVRYVGQIVAQRTGLAPADAEKRVTEVYARAQAKLRDAEVAAREAADKARKGSAYGALWLFVSLLGGAFVASLTATLGGRSRDA